MLISEARLEAASLFMDKLPDDQFTELIRKETLEEVQSGPPGSYFLPLSRTIIAFKSPLSGKFKLVRLRTSNNDQLPQMLEESPLTINKPIEETKTARLVFLQGRAIVRSIQSIALVLSVIDVIVRIAT